MLELIDIEKSYENRPLLNDISFTVAKGETICLLGPSGSGKSTLLRLIAGLEIPDGGRILWNGQDLKTMPAHERNFGLVFQDYALFPHLTVERNVAFGLRMKREKRVKIDQRVSQMLELVNLGGYENRQVTDLSGGEQQRVALARALAPDPRLLMFDEPLGALDRTLKDNLLWEIRQILHTARIPSIYVTHDQEEAYTIADRILLLRDGHIIQDGKPAEVIKHPVNRWAAEFLESGSILTGELHQGSIHTSIGRLSLPCDHKHRDGDQITLLIDRYMVEPVPEGEIRDTVVDVIFQPDAFRVTLKSGMVLHLPKAPAIGEEIQMRIHPNGIRCLTPDLLILVSRRQPI